MVINKNLMSRNHTAKKRSAADISFIVVHYVGALGDAKANTEYYKNNDVGASADFWVGFSGDIWQGNDYYNYYSWHCGGGLQGSSGHAFFGICKNSNSVGVEMCVKKRSTASMNATDKDWYFTDATTEAAAQLVAYLMQQLGVSIDHVIRHHDVTGKICPNPFVYDDGDVTWKEFKKKVQAYYSGQGGGSAGEAEDGKYYRVRKSWNDAASQTGAFTSLENAKNAVQDGYTVYDWNGNAVYSPGSGSIPGSGGGSSASDLVKAGQIHANNFCGAGITADGIRGSATKKAGIEVLQNAMNMDYGAGLTVDGIVGSRTTEALKGHTVRQGEKQYMVTALEILLLLKGYNPNGVESPGTFGAGLESAVRQYQSDYGLGVDGIAGYNTFMSLIR